MDYLKICGGSMKSTSEKSKEIKKNDSKKVPNNQMGLLVQAVLCVCGLIFLIISLFEMSFMPITQIIVAACLFVMAYNNQKVYKKNSVMNYVYIGFGIFLILSTIMDVFHG